MECLIFCLRNTTIVAEVSEVLLSICLRPHNTRFLPTCTQVRAYLDCFDPKIRNVSATENKVSSTRQNLIGHLRMIEAHRHEQIWTLLRTENNFIEHV